MPSYLCDILEEYEPKRLLSSCDDPCLQICESTRPMDSCLQGTS